ncbi:hypothetical protein RvY_09740 [Ramazzottius varieornatus]|uniref:inositol-phosphate phosphatase n=1 Tax=Ramazzottius varieornatus TaxID=947166 RepID=A0A1D1VAF9_RAMVA|nr:hypothetical protein RvY_09740 [Ramazzottius varieornatus]
MASNYSIGKVLHYAIQAAEYGGRQVKHVVDSGSLETTFKERQVDPVTVGDMRAHQVMTGILKQALPDVTVISEEDDTEKLVEIVDPSEYQNVPPPAEQFLKMSGQGELDPKSITIWIDPLDATQEYTQKLYEFVQVMVGIAVNGRPVGGVLHRPLLDTPVTYWAWKGVALSPELRDLPRKKNDVLKIVMSRTASHAGDVKGFSETAFGSKKFELVPAGGAGYKLLQVILGKADAYLHITKIKKWDLCAGHGVLNALGGNLTSLTGEEMDYRPPADTKQDVLVHDGFVAAVNDFDWFLKGCQKAHSAQKNQVNQRSVLSFS